jgi:poly(3-hydroxybutyrate) depolymerase
LRLNGAECVEPPKLHCPDKDCPSDVVTNQGSVVEPQTGRTYFLDYPCDLKQGEKVTVILDFHGGGSYGNWQRNYFPLMDYVKKYRLIVATPNSPGGAWPDKDNPYLENIATSIIDQVGAKNVKSFWLVGHSMGGFKSRRLVCTDFFKNKVDGYMSLSGSRVGSPPADAPAQFNIPQQDDALAKAAAAANGGARPPGPPPAGRALSVTPQGSLECEFSFIFAAGEHEPSIQNLPTTSSWAEKYRCGVRKEKREIFDTQAGYVYDSSRQQYGNDSWGRSPRGGTAKILEYPNCNDGRIVADIVREGKGHTEGYEPHITEELIKMMLSAKGGKIRAAN